MLIRLKHLDQFSIYFSRCLSGDFGSLDSPYNKALYRLHSTKTMQWYSIGMAAFHIKEGSGSAITDSLTRILKATYRLVLTQVVKALVQTSLKHISRFRLRLFWIRLKILIPSWTNSMW